MVETLTRDERDELMPFVNEKIDELIGVTAGADAATVERVVCLSVLRVHTDELPPEVGDMFLDGLEARAGEAGACLEAVALLGPYALSEAARDALARIRPATEDGIPQGTARCA